VFIDPPYNTGSAFTHYDDGLEHSIWLGLMRDRLEIIRRLLAEDGSLWITIDDNEAHYLKVLCDEVFGRANFVSVPDCHQPRRPRPRLLRRLRHHRRRRPQDGPPLDHGGAGRALPHAHHSAPEEGHRRRGHRAASRKAVGLAGRRRLPLLPPRAPA
jgi:hypothetical protein